MKRTLKKVKSGFTLIELLVVVLIIGILSAIALPGYRRSVERSRVSDALTTMQAVAKSEHGWYLTNNSYTNDFANLDIEINGTINEGALETDFYTYELLDTGILAERNNGEYSLYKDYESSQVLCMPGNHFVCENLIPFTKEPCERVGMAWANTNSTCYRDEEERCLGLYAEELGEGIWNGSFCGYQETSTNKPTGKTLHEGMKCTSYNYACENSIIESGATCEGVCNKAIINGGTCKGSCQYSTINDGGICYGKERTCQYSTINAGGLCIGNGNYSCAYPTINGGECNANCTHAIVNDGGICSGSCNLTTVNEGGKCISNRSNYCYNGTYSGTGCCEGDNCGNAPKCKCPIDENTGMHKTSC